MDIETTFAGKLRLLSITLGGIAVALTGPSLCRQAIACDQDSYSKELYFLAISYIALSASFILIVAIIFNISKGIRYWSIIDVTCHLLMAILLLLGWILFVVSVSYNAKRVVVLPEYRQWYNNFMAKRSFALILQFFNILAYLVTAFLAFKNRSRANRE
ncbi:uncharacterized protein LOC119070758 [Bradysia coprophila]|uniref:uncharacterized protein LOC119070758 n=1 Tax=Bradysia coprophila TaxID=38358 RepID=UPI00187D7560|nr:uncharacterized protein LOC119070758 [Bradysia coprophila]